jgi:signal transduction histidine kinase
MRILLVVLMLLGGAMAEGSPDTVTVDGDLASLEPAARIDRLLDRAETIRSNDPFGALALADSARREAVELADRRRLCRAELGIGVCHLFRRALAIAEAAGDSANAANALNNIGVIHYYWGEHDVAVDYYLQAARINERLGNREGLAKAYNNVAAILQTAGDYDQALDYFQRSLAMYEEEGKVGLQGASLNNIGLLHFEREEYDEAMAAYEQALSFARNAGDQQQAALSLNNMGMIWEQRGDLERALARYRESLAIREEIGDRQGALVCRHNIGLIQATQGHFAEGLANLEGAVAEARALEVLELERDALESLSLALENAGETARALAVYKEFKATDDTLRAQERSRQIIAAKTRYEVDLKDREIEVLRKDKEIERSRRNALLVGAAFSVLVMVLLFQRYRFQKRAADEIRRTNDALRRAHQDLERAARDELAHVARVATLGELAAAFAHELNQPLAAIQANARAGRNYLDQPGTGLEEVGGALEDIGEDAGRAREIISNLRRLMRKGEMRRERVAVAAMVADALRIIRPECDRQGVALDLEAAPDLPPVMGDRVQLQQVVINLVQNAASAMAGAAVADPMVSVRSARVGEAEVEVAVIDHGPAVADEVLGEMFEPFFTTRPRGLGMGLAICRTIIEAHGGRIAARRNEGAGLTVSFRLPAGAGEP